jgi:hypothetical protein
VAAAAAASAAVGEGEAGIFGRVGMLLTDVGPTAGLGIAVVSDAAPSASQFDSPLAVATSRVPYTLLLKLIFFLPAL